MPLSAEERIERYRRRVKDNRARRSDVWITVRYWSGRTNSFVFTERAEIRDIKRTLACVYNYEAGQVVSLCLNGKVLSEKDCVSDLGSGCVLDVVLCEMSVSLQSLARTASVPEAAVVSTWKECSWCQRWTHERQGWGGYGCWDSEWYCYGCWDHWRKVSVKRKAAW